ncbi:MAG: hypothetical protein J3K34DRAFT_441192 [Monoraphidium minutum]|nr:MAG: hypothetical protein J3K34DRAFT_441192 [Monoraphidium minutum]
MSGPGLQRFESASSGSYSDTYCRIVGQPTPQEPLPSVAEPDTSCDEAIAQAVAEEIAPAPPRADTSLDAALALQVHADEVDRLCGHEPPGVSVAAELDRLVRSALSGSRLCQLVPRLNPVPSSALGGYGVSRDRDRLLHRLAFYGLCEKEVQGDGNCQFRALSDQLYRSPDHHGAVRARICQHLAARPDRYSGYVTEPYGPYVAGMARPGTWGDHVTLQAAADAWGIKIFVITSFLENCIISIDPEREDPAFAHRALHLSFWAEVHYNSVYPASEKARWSPRSLLPRPLRNIIPG